LLIKNIAANQKYYCSMDLVYCCRKYGGLQYGLGIEGRLYTNKKSSKLVLDADCTPAYPLQIDANHIDAD
jgi:hypothetical protein